MKNILTLSLLILVACSEKVKTQTLPLKNNTQNFQNAYQANPTEYLAVLETMNKQVAANVSGNANFKIHDGDFVAYIRLFNSVPGLIHEQRFYQASSCPTIDEDTNADGFIDILELNSFLGHPVLPLDADINSEEAGMHTFPAGDVAGGYWYEQIVPLATLNNDLHAEDLNPTDDFEKLPGNEELSLDEGVIVILGVPATTILPETIASSAGYANFQTLPVACGTLSKIYLVPGRIEEDKADIIPEGEVGGVNGQYDNAPNLIHIERKAGNYGDEEE